MDVSIRDLADHFHVPKEWILLERTVLLLMGLCTELDPTLNPMEVIRPYLEEFVLGEDRDWSSFVIDSTKDVAATVFALPREVQASSCRSAQRGELEVRFRGIDEHARLIYSLGHQIIYAALGITAGAFGIVFDGRHEAHAAQRRLLRRRRIRGAARPLDPDDARPPAQAPQALERRRANLPQRRENSCVRMRSTDWRAAVTSASSSGTVFHCLSAELPLAANAEATPRSKRNDTSSACRASARR